MADTSNKNYYQLLGVEKDATAEQIKEAYREIARVFHPDSNFFDEIIEDSLPPESLDTFKAITQAYTILNNPAKRAEYDQTLPPELNDWEHHDNHHSRQSELKKSANGVSGMGTFGSGAHRGVHRVDPRVFKVESVAEMISRRRTIYGRILNILGL